MHKSLATVICLFCLVPVTANTAEIAEPFKVGTFEIDGAATVGIVHLIAVTQFAEKSFAKCPCRVG